MVLLDSMLILGHCFPSDTFNQYPVKEYGKQASQRRCILPQNSEFLLTSSPLTLNLEARPDSKIFYTFCLTPNTCVQLR